MKKTHSPTLRPNRAIELAIIGGGAAGLFAAVTAASRGIPCLEARVCVWWGLTLV